MMDSQEYVSKSWARHYQTTLLYYKEPIHLGDFGPLWVTILQNYGRAIIIELIQ
jgi:hypothetical protein